MFVDQVQQVLKGTQIKHDAVQSRIRLFKLSQTHKIGKEKQQKF